MLREQWTLRELVAKKSSYLKFGLGFPSNVLGNPEFLSKWMRWHSWRWNHKFHQLSRNKTTPKNMSNI